jgi:hypothetical protein
MSVEIESESEARQAKYYYGFDFGFDFFAAGDVYLLRAVAIIIFPKCFTYRSKKISKMCKIGLKLISGV